MVHSGDFTNGAGFTDIFDANFTAGKRTADGFRFVNPARLLETRVGLGPKTIDGLWEGDGRLADGETIEFQVTGCGGIPASTDSASLNVVAISADKSRRCIRVIGRVRFRRRLSTTTVATIGRTLQSRTCP